MRKFKIYTLAAFVLFAGIVGCENKEDMNTDTSSHISIQEVTQSLDEQNQKFMDTFQHKDTTNFVQLYTEDGWMMPPNAPTIKGRQGIKQFVMQAQKMGLGKLELTTGEVFMPNDSAAVETGNYKLYATNDQPIDHGSYMVYWKKDGDTWRLFRDIWNSDKAPAKQEGK